LPLIVVPFVLLLTDHELYTMAAARGKAFFCQTPPRQSRRTDASYPAKFMRLWDGSENR